VRILLDQNVPVGVRTFLDKEHDVFTAAREGLAALTDAELLSEAEARGFDILVTCDQSMPYQQNMTGRAIKLRVLWTNSWLELTREYERVIAIILDE
jgi:predicted nuclease of predicted toxin-antitoxin system